MSVRLFDRHISQIQYTSVKACDVLQKGLLRWCWSVHLRVVCYVVQNVVGVGGVARLYV
jgi:hypothetical protein